MDVSPNIMAVPQSYHQISANSLRFMMHDAILTDESPQKRQPQSMTSNLAKAFTFYISYFHHIFLLEALIVLKHVTLNFDNSCGQGQRGRKLLHRSPMKFQWQKESSKSLQGKESYKMKRTAARIFTTRISGLTSWNTNRPILANCPFFRSCLHLPKKCGIRILESLRKGPEKTFRSFRFFLPVLNIL